MSLAADSLSKFWSCRSRFLAAVLLLLGAIIGISVANSPLSAFYFEARNYHLGPVSLLHLVNDVLMALFFLLMGLEVKREIVEGKLSTWPRRILPGAAALGGMLVPAMVYLAFNYGNRAASAGWAVPAATDIAFALGTLSLLGSRVPTGLNVFLTALAVMDDVGIIIVIALFYSADPNVPAIGGIALVLVALLSFSRFGVRIASPYLAMGVLLWLLLFVSGVHTTMAGVLLALAIPIDALGGDTSSGTERRSKGSLADRFEQVLFSPVHFVIVPLFGLANAGVSISGLDLSATMEPVTLGVALGLVLGKVTGVFGTTMLLVRLGLAKLPASADWIQTLGVSLLCGVGFTISLFVALLAFNEEPDLLKQAKVGILCGSLIAGVAGYTVLRVRSSMAKA